MKRIKFEILALYTSLSGRKALRSVCTLEARTRQIAIAMAIQEYGLQAYDEIKARKVTA